MLLALGDLHLVPVARVLDVGLDKGQNFETPAFGKLALFVWDKPVKQAVATIFGQIRNAGSRVDARGFMVEPTHRFKRLRRDQASVAGRNLENIAMILAYAIASLGHIFLARQPASPRRNPARTVADGARKAEPLGLALACLHVVDQRRCATGQRH